MNCDTCKSLRAFAHMHLWPLVRQFRRSLLRWDRGGSHQALAGCTCSRPSATHPARRGIHSCGLSMLVLLFSPQQCSSRLHVESSGVWSAQRSLTETKFKTCECGDEAHEEHQPTMNTDLMSRSGCWLYEASLRTCVQACKHRPSVDKLAK